MVLRGRSGRSGATPRQRLLFGWDYEDERIELGVLQPGSRVIALAGAGELITHLAAAGHEVVAVGANRIQLDYARRRTQGAPAEMGSAERFMDVGRALIRAATSAWRRRKVRGFLQESSPERVRRMWRGQFDNRTFRSILHATLAPAGALSAAVQRDFSTPIPAHFTDTIRARLDERIAIHPLPDNRFAWRLLLGEDPPGHVLPAIPAGSISFVSRDMLSVLEDSTAGAFDAVLLSNIADGARADAVGRLASAASRAVTVRGPVVSRTFSPTLDAEAAARAATDRSLIWGAVSVGRVAHT